MAPYTRANSSPPRNPDPSACAASGQTLVRPTTSVRMWRRVTAQRIPLYRTLRDARPQLLLFAVTFQGELHQAVEELRVLDAGGLPQLRIHADRGEAGDRVYFVD